MQVDMAKLGDPAYRKEARGILQKKVDAIRAELAVFEAMLTALWKLEPSGNDWDR